MGTGTRQEQDGGARTRFDRFAEAVSQFVSRGVFFTGCLVAVAIWMPTLFLFASLDTWQLVINTLTSVLAFLLIALLQNSERRYDEALHTKIDAIAGGLADLMEHTSAPSDRSLDEDVERLRSSIGLERRT
jgi:low affinity Fe/Cu permease